MNKRNEKKKALITGITGQDGSYLAEFLLKKGYEVHGLVRRSSTWNRQNIQDIFDTVDKQEKYLHYGDMSDINSLINVLEKVKPHEVYNLAAQSHVRVSFDIPYYTTQSDAVGVLSLLEAIRLLRLSPKIYQASTSELYSGDPTQAPQNERTPFKPKSPYGASKLYAFEIARIYRESYDMFVCNGILFNHESPRRGTNFVTRKIVRGLIEAKNNKGVLRLGNLNARRDWGYAPEYMEAAWKMLQQQEPDDYVIATGETHTVREFAEKACENLGIQLAWRGMAEREIGYDKRTGKTLITIDPNFYRPNEVEHLCGDASKAKEILKWKPKVTFEKLVEIMVRSELASQ